MRTTLHEISGHPEVVIAVAFAGECLLLLVLMGLGVDPTVPFWVVNGVLALGGLALGVKDAIATFRRAAQYWPLRTLLRELVCSPPTILALLLVIEYLLLMVPTCLGVDLTVPFWVVNGVIAVCVIALTVKDALATLKRAR